MRRGAYYSIIMKYITIHLQLILSTYTHITGAAQVVRKPTERTVTLVSVIQEDTRASALLGRLRILLINLGYGKAPGAIG